MVANSQQFGHHHAPSPVKQVKEADTSSIEQQLAQLTSLVQQLAVGNMQQVKTCGICYNIGHPTNMCHTLQDESMEQANCIEGFLGAPRKYDPYSNTYNLGWRDHPNFSYGRN